MCCEAFSNKNSATKYTQKTQDDDYKMMSHACILILYIPVKISTLFLNIVTLTKQKVSRLEWLLYVWIKKKSTHLKNLFVFLQ